MTRTRCLAWSTIVLLAASAMNSSAQQSSETTGSPTNSQASSTAPVPPLVRFGGFIKDAEGNALSGVITVTFSLYSEQTGGSALWQETQNVTADSNGHYSAVVGSTQPQGIPTQLFTTGEARWLGVRPQGQAEQARVLLVSAPYALKAADAETLGGFPPSAFMLASPTSGTTVDSTTGSTPGVGTSESAPPPAGTVTGSGTPNFVTLWTSSSNIGNSVLFQSGSGATAKIGINTITPGATLDVKGSANIEGLLALPATGVATSSGGKNSQAQNFVVSSFNSSTNKAVNQTFQWQAEPTGNDTATPSGTLNLLFGSGTSKPTETGLKISNTGLFTFANGQTFPGTGTITGITTATGSGLTGGGTSGNLTLSLLKTCSTSQTLQWNGSSWACSSAGTGTITGVTAGTDLTGGGTSGSVTLNLDTTKVPLLSATNTFNANQNITGNLSDTGNISATGSVTGQTGSFTANNTTETLVVTQNGSGAGVFASTATTNGAAVFGYAPATTGTSYGVEGVSGSSSPNSAGVLGQGGAVGVQAIATSAAGTGVLGQGGGYGVQGTATTGSGVGVYGIGPTGVQGTSSTAPAAGVAGENVATSGFGYGVWGQSAYSPNGIGVYGEGSFNGVWGTSSTGFGVFGENSNSKAGVAGAFVGDGINGIGMTGTSVVPSNESFTVNGLTPGVGVWGDAGAPGGYAGVAGSADDSNAGVFYNNSPSGWATLYARSDESSNSGNYVFYATGNHFGGNCAIDVSGNLTCSGTKSAVVPVDGGARKVALYAVESPENWFEDFGSSKLTNGLASIALEVTFAQTVNTGEDYHVFLTPNGDCNGLYVTQKTAGSFEVRELAGGKSDVAFDYRIVAKRKGYETIRLADRTRQFEAPELSRRPVQRENLLPRLPRAIPTPPRRAAPPVHAAIMQPPILNQQTGPRK